MYQKKLVCANLIRTDLEEKQWHETPEYDLTSPKATEPITAPQLQSQESNAQAERQEAAPQPVLELRGAHIIKRPIHGQSHRLGGYEEYDDQEYPDERVFSPFVNVYIALARFYYRPDAGVDAWLHLQGHVYFYDSSGTLLKEVFTPVWYGENKPVVSVKLAEARELVIALVPASKGAIATYEYASTTRIARGRGREFFSPKVETIAGEKFFIKVELIGKAVSDVRVRKAFEFTLILKPEPKLEEVTPGPQFTAQAANKENTAKREYIIERLKELIRRDAEIGNDGYVGLDSPTFMTASHHHGHMKRFLEDYFNEADVKRFEKAGVSVLEKLLKDLLEQ